MPDPEIVVRVRFRSDLSLDEVTAVVERRAPEFAALSGLQQKYYLQEVGTGEFAGLYIWESAAAFAEFRESELRATIAEAYRTRGEPDVEVYRVFKVLRA